ncbi:MAG: SDR family NAD(P)-dependent oxidoreductase, partial [Bacteroidia bacterium]
SIGAQINWTALHDGLSRKKISLPSYSFEPDRFPVIVDPIGQLQSGLIPKTGQETLKDWIYIPEWKSTQLSDIPECSEKQVFVFFNSGSDWDNLILDELNEKEEHVISVLPGRFYVKESPSSYSINLMNEEEYYRVIEEIKSDGFHPTDVLHSWSLGIASGQLSLKEDNTEINRVYFSLARIVKALSANKCLDDIRIGVITESLHRINGNENCEYAQALVLALVNTIPQETSARITNIDLPTFTVSNKDSDFVYREIKNLGEHRIVGLRNGKKWLPDFQKNQKETEIRKTVLKKNGAYLVTGGLGNLGFILAKYLSSVYNAKLILTGRALIPEHISINTEPHIAMGFRRLQELKNLGNEVSYYPIDMANRDQAALMMNKAEYETGLVQGIIHTAGINDHSFFEAVNEITPASTFELASAKVTGVMVLDSLLKTRTPDFVWMSSSLSSILGGLTYSSYSAGNLFMDYFARSRPKAPTSWKSVCLGEMLLDEESLKLEKGQTRTGLTPTEICKLFEWSLVQNDAVFVQSVLNLEDRMKRIESIRFEVERSALKTQGKSIELVRSELSTAFVAPTGGIEARLIEMIEQFLG